VSFVVVGATIGIAEEPEVGGTAKEAISTVLKKIFLKKKRDSIEFFTKHFLTLSKTIYIMLEKLEKECVQIDLIFVRKRTIYNNYL